MKNILVLALTVITLGSGIAFAESESVLAVDAFKASKDVVATVAAVSQEMKKENGGDVKLVVSIPTAALISYSCGAKGCISLYLVTVVISPRSVNPQGRLVAATVRIRGTHGAAVEILDRAQTTKLQNLLN